MNSFGRRFQPDERDKSYPMSAVLPAEVAGVDTRYWNDTQWWGDQGSKPWCVAFAWLHWAEDGPVTHKGIVEPIYTPSSVYHSAQRIDEWPGENYAGTSVRAGAKVLQENGIISAYHWAQNVHDIIRAILTVGPVVLGTKWYEGMSRPDKNFVMKPTGVVLGGHAYVLNGINANKQLFRMKNSWGRGWGKNGRAWISFANVQDLLFAQGEACLAIEIN